MKHLNHLIIVVALTIPSQTIWADIVGDVRGDWVQGVNIGDLATWQAAGTGQWKFFQSDTANPTLDATVETLQWTGTEYRMNTGGGSANTAGLNATLLGPDEIRLTSSNSTIPPAYVVARWVAGPGENGPIDIDGHVRHVPGLTGGDGSRLLIVVDGASIYDQVIAGSDTVGYDIHQSAIVSVGSTVDFVIHAVGSDIWDHTGLQARITTVPEPETMIFFLVALAVVSPRSRWRSKRQALNRTNS